MRTVSRYRHRWSSVMLVVLGVLLGIGLRVGQANHIFSDVPSAAIYHDATEWLFNRGVTLGCATGLYCPNEFVTRAQMALFMQRLGKALTPGGVLQTGSGSSVVDLDSNPVVCASTTDFMPTFPQAAVFFANASIQPTAALSYWALGVYSTNGGTSWSVVPGTLSVEAKATDTAGHTPLSSVAALELSVGTQYRAGIQLQRAVGSSGTGDIAVYRCSLGVLVFNRNPQVSPLISPRRSR